MSTNTNIEADTRATAASSQQVAVASTTAAAAAAAYEDTVGVAAEQKESQC